MARRSIEAYRTGHARLRRRPHPRHLVRPPRGRRVVERLPEASATQGRDDAPARPATTTASRRCASSPIEVDGEYRIRSDPPVLVPLRELDLARSTDGRRDDRGHGPRRLPQDPRPEPPGAARPLPPVDAALKVVGVGSVGTRCWIVLFEGRDRDDPLFLQVKEAGPIGARGPPAPEPGTAIPDGGSSRASSSCRPAGTSSSAGRPGPEGRATTCASSGTARSHRHRPLTAEDRRLRRALRPHPGPGPRPVRATPSPSPPTSGSGDAFDRAVAEFAEAYAQQAVDDHARFLDAIDAGRLSAAMD